MGALTWLHPPRRGGAYEKDPSTGAYKKYYQLGGKLGAEREVPSGGTAATIGTLHSLHRDHLGSTTLQTSAAGVHEGHQFRGPFGQPWGSGGSLATDLQYTGQRSFEVSLGSLLHYGARWYSPVLGKFLSADTIVPNPGNPQSLNRYAYTLNNPLRYVDPTGHVATGPRTIAKPGDVEAGYSNENGHLLVGRWIQYDWGASFDRDGEISWSMDQGGLLDDVASTANQALKDVVAQQAPDSRPGWDRPCQVDSGLLCNMIRPMGAILVPGPPMDCGPLCPADEVSSGVRATGKATSGGASTAVPVRGALTEMVSGATIVHNGKTVGKGTIDLRGTIQRINSGGTFPHSNDGALFKNVEKRLPLQTDKNYYTEYVHPTAGISGPGPQRVVVGKGGEWYYSPDHYRTFVPLN